MNVKMERLKLNMSHEEAKKTLAEDNSGAMVALSSAQTETDEIDFVLKVLLKLDSKGIYGEKIWDMFKKECQEDGKKFVEVCTNL